MHDDDWVFTMMDAKIGSPTLHTWGLKSIQQRYNIHTYLSVIASNDEIIFWFHVYSNVYHKQLYLKKF